MAKERYQNPVVGDDLTLRLFIYNSNNRADVTNINKIEIFYLDPAERSESNPQGRRLVQTIDETDVIHEATGQYSISLPLPSPTYVIGHYRDVWTLEVEPGENPATIENPFELFPDLWFTTPIPVVYDFSFSFMPNKLRHGSKRFLIINIRPNVPKASDLERYYTNLAIVSPVTIYIEQACGPCMPAEQDLRMVVEGALVELREKCVGYYFLDTEQLDLACGIYNVWFEMEFGESKYISDKSQLQIF